MICPWLNVWLSIRASGFLILHSFTQSLCAKCCDKLWKYKLKVTQFTLKTIRYKAEKQMNRQFPCRVINTQTQKMAQGTLRRDSQLCVNAAGFLVQVLWKWLPEGQEKVQQEKGRRTYKDRR